MSGEFEAAGAMATAGLVAGAIEGREAHGSGDGKCLNCASDLQGAYCHACGQAAHAHRTLAHVFEEFLHGVIHFDTKAWRTLPMVIFRPGTLTRNYIYGQRARYISPLALFLFTIFFMFAVFAFTGSPAPDLELDGTQTRAGAEAALTEAREDVTEAERELAEKLANPDPNQPAGLEERLARMEVRLAQEEVARREAALARVEAAITQAESGETQEGVTVETTVDGVTVTEEDQTWQQQVQRGARNGEITVNTGFPSLDERILKKLENPDLALYKVQQAAYKFSFLLVPISLPFIWLLFVWKRGLTLYDHVVYALYALCFASLLFVLIAFVATNTYTNFLTGWLILTALPVHTFFHLKGAYALGWWSALWRTFFMLIFAVIAASLFLVAIIVLGLTG
ncbi:Gll1812 protein [alpha proteobacterium U9-1i]|nr:Gll1812 protein [alpha proteobacterium U9-1i]